MSAAIYSEKYFTRIPPSEKTYRLWLLNSLIQRSLTHPPTEPDSLKSPSLQPLSLLSLIVNTSSSGFNDHQSVQFIEMVRRR